MTDKFYALPKRPLRLAERLQELRRNGEVIPISIRGKVYHLAPPSLAGTVPVVLDAVSDWWDLEGSDKWPSDSLEPRLRLPWTNLWAEWSDRAAARARSLPYADYGVMAYEVNHSNVRKLYAEWNEAEPPLKDDLWAVFYLFIDWGADITGFRPLVVPVNAPADSNGGICFDVLGRRSGDKPDDLEVMAPWEGLAVWRLFTSLLGVRNISVVDVGVHRTQRKRLRVLEDDGSPPPWISYKTLAITLPTGGSGSSGRGSDGLQRPIPFHLVRGHMADYRNGAGMFGRYRDVVWKPMHFRGLQRCGAIAKTYTSYVSGATPRGAQEDAE